MKKNLQILLPIFLIIAPYQVSSTQFRLADIFCDNDIGNYTSNSTYQNNLNLLFTSLQNNALKFPFWFDRSPDQGTDQVDMLYNCLGNLNGKDCHDCVTLAAESAVTECPNQKAAIVWYEECMLRYANYTINNYEDERPYTWRYSNENVSDPSSFDDAVVATLESVIMKAAYNKSNNGYADGKGDVSPTAVSNVGSFDKVYGVAQCTPDILGTRCERCLRTSLRSMAGCCGVARQWLQMYLPSCQLRYTIIDPSFTFNPRIPLPPSPKTAGATAKMIKLDGDFIMFGLIVAVNVIFTMPTTAN